MAAGMSPFPKIILKPGKEQSVKRYHPWVFSGAIAEINGNPKEGEVVHVFSSRNEWLAMGHYQIGSIAVRIFSFEDTEPAYPFWFQKLTAAWHVRQNLSLTRSTDTNVYRLVHGEGDGLPGLVIDYYNGLVVMQYHSIGMYLIRQMWADALQELYGSQLKAIFDKSEQTLPFKAGLGAKNEFLRGSPASFEIAENGCRFIVDAEKGQKTGFFIDQRENRKLIQQYAPGKEMLNLFCYTGGFSVYGLKGGAMKVTSVDSSEPAISAAIQHVTLNGLSEDRHEPVVADAISFLNDKPGRFDLVVLDPPAFAKHLDALDQALQAYKRLNAKAILNIRPGGILFTFSCSQVVTRDHFRKSIFAASANTGRHVRILHQLFQPPDHPVSIYHPEGEYLKGFVLQVE